MHFVPNHIVSFFLFYFCEARDIYAHLKNHTLMDSHVVRSEWELMGPKLADLGLEGFLFSMMETYGTTLKIVIDRFLVSSDYLYKFSFLLLSRIIFFTSIKT